MGLLKKVILLVSAVTLFMVNIASAQSEVIVKNHILIIDKTGSMIGKGSGGSADIWDKVKNAVIGYIDKVEVGEKVTLYTFHENVDPVMNFSISSNKVKEEIKEAIKSLEADGSWTCTYKSIEEIFGNLDKDEMNIIHLYTDGKDSGNNKCGVETLNSAIHKYDLSRGDYDYLFYITLGFEPPKELEEAIDNTDGASIIRSKKGEVPNINIVSPKSFSLEFTKQKLSLNQGFILYSAKGLPSGFNVKIDPTQVKIEKLSNTQFNPEFKKLVYAASSDEEVTLKFLNDINKFDEGVYTGYYKYVIKPDENSHTYVIPDEIKLVFKNIPESKVKIQFKDVD